MIVLYESQVSIACSKKNVLQTFKSLEVKKMY